MRRPVAPLCAVRPGNACQHMADPPSEKVWPDGRTTVYIERGLEHFLAQSSLWRKFYLTVLCYISPFSLNTTSALRDKNLSITINRLHTPHKDLINILAVFVTIFALALVINIQPTMQFTLLTTAAALVTGTSAGLIRRQGIDNPRLAQFRVWSDYNCTNLNEGFYTVDTNQANTCNTFGAAADSTTNGYVSIMLQVLTEAATTNQTCQRELTLRKPRPDGATKHLRSLPLL